METKKVTYEAPEGCTIGSVQIENGRLIVVYECEKPEAPKFKRGDFVVREAKPDADTVCSIGIFGGERENWLWIYNDMVNKEAGKVSGSPDRLATPEEKQLLLDKMHEQGKYWDGGQIVDWEWSPKMGEPYWVVTADGVAESQWDNDHVDQKRLRFNQIFSTEALAQAAFTDLQTILKQAKKY